MLRVVCAVCVGRPDLLAADSDEDGSIHEPVPDDQPIVARDDGFQGYRRCVSCYRYARARCPLCTRTAPRAHARRDATR